MRQELIINGVDSGRKPRQAQALTPQRVSLLRLVLSVAALVAIYIDPSEPDRLVTLTYAALSLYVLYCASLYVLSRLGHHIVTRPVAYWADVGWYVLFISLSSGTNSIFFFFFFFAILVASFTDGLRAGLAVTLISASLFTIVGYLSAPSGEVEMNRLVLRVFYMLVLGYMIARWGGSEVRLKERLSLLREIGDFSNPRFGIDRTLAFLLEKLCANFNAKRCLMLTAGVQRGGYLLHASNGGRLGRGGHAEAVSPAFAEKLLSTPEEKWVVCEAGDRWLPRRDGALPGGASGNGRAALEDLANLLDARSFLSVPVRFRGGPAGRLYLLSDRARAFSDSDAAFVEQTLSFIIPIIENIRLVDELASSAAEQERQRIARDLHDSVIQPYIGLRIGLAAVRQKLDDGADAAADVDRLIKLAEAEIEELRSYMRGLKGERAQRDNLLPAVQRFAAKFAAATQIDLCVNALDDFRVSDRLAAEIFQIVAEGLSNVRRHTAAKRASVTLEVRDNDFCLKIENEEWEGATPDPFRPRSISERVDSLGGSLEIEKGGGGRTALKIRIPL